MQQHNTGGPKKGLTLLGAWKPDGGGGGRHALYSISNHPLLILVLSLLQVTMLSEENYDQVQLAIG